MISTRQTVGNYVRIDREWPLSSRFSKPYSLSIVTVVVLIKWSYRSPLSIMSIVEVRMVIIFGAHVLLVFVLEPHLTTYHLINTSNGVIIVILKLLDNQTWWFIIMFLRKSKPSQITLFFNFRFFATSSMKTISFFLLIIFYDFWNNRDLRFFLLWELSNTQSWRFFTSYTGKPKPEVGNQTKYPPNVSLYLVRI